MWSDGNSSLSSYVANQMMNDSLLSSFFLWNRESVLSFLEEAKNVELKQVDPLLTYLSSFVFCTPFVNINRTSLILIPAIPDIWLLTFPVEYFLRRYPNLSRANRVEGRSLRPAVVK